MTSTLKIDTVATPDGTGNITFSRPIVADGSNLTNLTAGKVLQIQEARKIDTFSTTTSASQVDITGLSVDITPSATDSKILVFGQLNSGTTTGDGVYRLVRDSTSLGQGTDNGASPISGLTGLGQHRNTNELATGSFVYLDTAISTTSQVTYKIGIFKRGTVALYINRTTSEGGENERVSSSITAIEIGA